jgi:methyltransferase (TIGR00027 family)
VNEYSLFEVGPWSPEAQPHRPAQRPLPRLERRLPRPLIDDPWARLLRGRYRLAALLPAGTVARAIDRRWPGPRAAVVVRTRYIDDALNAALAAGLGQVVILGAGLDSRAHRLRGIERAAVFEVDHPATQAMKRRVVGRRPPHLTTPLDLTRGRLDAVLPAAGFRADAPALFVWEGVTNYLDDASVDATLRFIARSGTALLFTYVDRAILDGSRRFEGAAESAAYVRRLGEPFTFGLVRARSRPIRDAAWRWMRTFRCPKPPPVTIRPNGRRCRPTTTW